MSKDQLIRKLTSRKLWLSVASFISMLMVARGSTESEAAQVAALVMAGASVIGYALAEGLADASRKDADDYSDIDAIDAIGLYQEPEDDETVSD